MTIGTRRLAASAAAAAGLLLAAGPATSGVPTPGGWAIVDDDGTLGANRNVVRVSLVQTGVYRVVFNQDVSHCAATATLAAHNGRNSIVPGYIVTGRNGNFPEQLRVYTFNTVTLLPQNFRFNLLASC